MKNPSQDLYTFAKVMLVDEHPHLHAIFDVDVVIWSWDVSNTLEIHLQYHPLFISIMTLPRARPLS